ncbi:MAG: type II secretion system protein [Phycisphaerae bacterium]|nr:type II secretion system protein [Phycisphaerae bacterium]
MQVAGIHGRHGRATHQRNADRVLGRRGFTLIELLVVIVVIGLLIAAIALVGGKVFHSQKIKLTETIMKNTAMAIEQFAEENPLRAVYGLKEGPGPDGSWGGFDDACTTFGPYPPYQLAGNAIVLNSVPEVLEPNHPLFHNLSPPFPSTLPLRLARDLSGKSSQNLQDWVWAIPVDDRDNDIRALYTYLSVYSPGVLSQVPPDRIKPLADTPEYVNPTGAGPAPGEFGSTWVDVFGIHDAWDVPLDYFLYVKLEWGRRADSDPNPGGVWRVVDRRPVLRSRGVTREAHEVWLEEWQGNLNAPPPDSAKTWLFSEAFPSPPANPRNVNFWRTGIIDTHATRQNGWARALGEGDLYTVGGKDDQSFGYVP